MSDLPPSQPDWDGAQRVGIQAPGTGRATDAVLRLPVRVGAITCLFVGVVAWAFQGYQEDAGVSPVQSWPIGSGTFLAGGVFILGSVWLARPGITHSSIGRIAGSVAVALAAGALYVLGQPPN